jgi:predicted RNA-binding Zn-ribbon protein involved in translation (DUF1610 family)
LKASLDVTNLAMDRLANFQVVLGGRYQCPRCGIYRGRQAPLALTKSSARRLVFRCETCHSALHVEK